MTDLTDIERLRRQVCKRPVGNQHAMICIHSKACCACEIERLTAEGRRQSWIVARVSQLLSGTNRINYEKAMKVAADEADKLATASGSQCPVYEPVDSIDDTFQEAADPDICRYCGEDPHDDYTRKPSIEMLMKGRETTLLAIQERCAIDLWNKINAMGGTNPDSDPIVAAEIKIIGEALEYVEKAFPDARYGPLSTDDSRQATSDD